MLLRKLTLRVQALNSKPVSSENSYRDLQVASNMAVFEDEALLTDYNLRSCVLTADWPVAVGIRREPRFNAAILLHIQGGVTGEGDSESGGITVAPFACCSASSRLRYTPPNLSSQLRQH